ncbi:hypothetical protein BC834DRAFT_560781 [Gloeopeniophorella convolvens]|nr:hypothetical protein BC834DRAFT_560781 [Gloeopeniophorella convolvens]
MAPTWGPWLSLRQFFPQHRLLTLRSMPLRMLHNRPPQWRPTRTSPPLLVSSIASETIGSHLSSHKALTFSTDTTPSPRNAFPPYYDGGILPYTEALHSACYATGALASQQGQSVFARGPMQAVSQGDLGGGIGQGLGSDDTPLLSLLFDRSDIDWILSQQPVAGPSTARIGDDVVDPRWLQ